MVGGRLMGQQGVRFVAGAVCLVAELDALQFLFARFLPRFVGSKFSPGPTAVPVHRPARRSSPARHGRFRR